MIMKLMIYADWLVAAFGVWNLGLEFSVWLLEFGIWFLVFEVWNLKFGFWVLKFLPLTFNLISLSPYSSLPPSLQRFAKINKYLLYMNTLFLQIKTQNLTTKKTS
nr:hypothetical protein [uncultured Marinifilum sp.]